MHKSALYFFYVILLSLSYSTYGHAFASADFEGGSYSEANEGQPIAYVEDEDPPHIQRLADYHDYYASNQSYDKSPSKKRVSVPSSYASRMPQMVDGYGEKVIIVNPHKHVWGAYSAEGNLLRAGLATAGASWCPDIHRACRTRSGSFRIYTLGSSSCYSKRYPVGKGGAPMPYCMFFNGNQGLHGSHEIAEANLSHGCVRVSVSDAEWIRFNFATIGTKVIVTSY